jgi:hypothetical protein
LEKAAPRLQDVTFDLRNPYASLLGS